MSIIISNNGNLDGINQEKENTPEYIINALNKGFDVKINVSYKNGNYYLKENYQINFNFLREEKLWIQCNDLETLQNLNSLLTYSNLFYLENSPTLTKSDFIWLPSLTKPINNKTILYLPELDWNYYNDGELFTAKAICTNYPIKIGNK